MSKLDLTMVDYDDIEDMFHLDLDDDIYNNKFEKIHKKRRFDDGTRKITTGRKKSKVIRGGEKDIDE